MKIDRLPLSLLSLMALSLAAIALHSYIAPPPVHASSDAPAIYVEPGVSLLRAPDGSRQVFGKVIVDLRTGNIRGFPTLSQDPYPAAGANTTPPVSHPFLLGKFALGDMDK